MNNKIAEKHKKKFQRLVNQLNKLIEEVREYEPKANYYLDGTSNLNLMTGPSHCDKTLLP